MRAGADLGRHDVDIHDEQIAALADGVHDRPDLPVAIARRHRVHRGLHQVGPPLVRTLELGGVQRGLDVPLFLLFEFHRNYPIRSRTTALRLQKAYRLARRRYFCHTGKMEKTEAATAFAALSQETRLDLVRLLIAHGASGLPAGEIAAQLAIPSSTLSFHLTALERAGLTQATRQGRYIVHAVRIGAVRQLLGFLTETCCGGRPELCGDIAHLLPPLPDEANIMTPAFNVLFLCTRNSARSIMAEAILEKIGGGRFNAYSAGSHPAAEPMPEVIERLRTLGHDVGRLHTKSWRDFMRSDAPRFDFVIALCDMLRGQQCPEFGDKTVTGAWPLPDPAQFAGNDAERALLLNELYGGLRRRIEIFISLPFATLDRMALKARLDEIGDPSAATLERSR
jgi:protein-tyrosine-phosphatase/DNA-binding transcriptional ArsR family regulator